MPEEKDNQRLNEHDCQPRQGSGLTVPLENSQGDYARALAQLDQLERCELFPYSGPLIRGLGKASWRLLRALLLERRDLLGSKPWEETAADAALRDFAGGSR